MAAKDTRRFAGSVFGVLFIFDCVVVFGAGFLVAAHDHQALGDELRPGVFALLLGIPPGVELIGVLPLRREDATILPFRDLVKGAMDVAGVDGVRGDVAVQDPEPDVVPALEPEAVREVPVLELEVVREVPADLGGIGGPVDHLS